MVVSTLPLIGTSSIKFFNTTVWTGIAVAAALGLAKVAIIGITIYIKMTEAFFHFMESNVP